MTFVFMNESIQPTYLDNIVQTTVSDVHLYNYEWLSKLTRNVELEKNIEGDIEHMKRSVLLVIVIDLVINFR